MNTPKVIFKYAYPLDKNRRSLYTERNWPGYPDIAEVRQRLEEYKTLWEKHNAEDKIIKRIIDILGVSYPRDIEAYVFGMGMPPMSAPFLLPIAGQQGKYTDEQFIEIMVHELTHIFVANTEENLQLRNYWKHIREVYQNESPSVQNHLIVYAVEGIVLSELFGKDKMKELISAESPDYKRAIELTEELGPQRIIEEFRNSIHGD